VLDAVGVDPASESLTWPSWNGERLEELLPWGAVRTPTPEANKQTANELDADEAAEIRRWVEPLLGPLGF